MKKSTKPLRVKMLLLSMAMFTICLVSCKTVLVIPADRVIRYDGTNYIVPPLVMQDILKRLNALTITNTLTHP